MNPRTVLITHVSQYAGPGALEQLVALGEHVLAHDHSFHEDSAREAFRALHPHVVPLASQNPHELALEMQALGKGPQALILNAVHAITPCAVESVAIEDLQSTFEDIVLFSHRACAGDPPCHA